MKRLRHTTILFALVFLFSCNSTIEEDATEYAELQCRTLRILSSSKDGVFNDTDGKEIDTKKLQAEKKKIIRKIHKKYPEGTKQSKKLKKVYNQKIKECLGINVDIDELDLRLE